MGACTVDRTHLAPASRPEAPAQDGPRDQHHAAAPMPAMSSGISTSFFGRWLIGGLADCQLDPNKGKNP